MFESKVGIWRLSLEQIEATVADHLGRGRVQGNQPGTDYQTVSIGRLQEILDVIRIKMLVTLSA